MPLHGCAGLLLLALLILTPPRVTATDCGERHGRVERLNYRSEQISTDMVYSVYTPPCYDASRDALPVLYLFHGSNDDDGHWQRLGLIETLDTRISAGTLPPLIVVLPFGNWIANEARFGVGGWDAVFMGDLLPRVEAQYRADAARRLIGGISRGGFWAYVIGLRHPGEFRAIGGHSAFFGVNNTPPEFNPLDLARTVGALPALWLDRGLDDYAAEGLDLMRERLRARRIEHTYSIAPGEHINAYWSSRLDDYLDFYAAAITPAPDVSPFATQTPVPTASGYRLFLPVTAFPSTRFSLNRVDFDALLAGAYDPALTVSEAAVQALADHGVKLHPGTQTVADDTQVYNTLWRDRARYGLVPFSALTPRLRVLWLDDVHPLDALADYPLVFASAAPDFDPARLTSIVATGVTAMARNSVAALDENGVDWAATGMAAYFARADFVHVSNEVSFFADCPRPSDQMLGGNSSFCSKPAHFEVLERLGVDIVELSGNHNNDYGYQPYLDTLDWYRQRGMRTVGGGTTLEEARAPLILEHNGNRVAWIACNWVGPYYALVEESASALGGPRPGAAACDRAWLREAIQTASAAHDLLIVSVQYTERDQHPPTPEQRADFAQLAEWGADVIIGTQAHFTQTHDLVRGRGGKETFIHYGPGNFIFDQPFWAGMRFMIDRLLIYDGLLVNVEPYPGIIDGLARPRPMTADERLNFAHVLFVQNGGL
jgi:poly-gamma-glutamate synthesis protein (capsule biosynthesis protein)